ncbi:hypothetical protein [Rhodopseudomonas palustris]|uniref:Uncharacterized protein n=1 Tax=Rhodopseudomonas palustris (strain BisB18) TaxID=316056 RepID=Q217L5_RHOPB
MATVVTMDVYSGRPNPVWRLSDQEESALNERLSSLSRLTDQRPSGIVGGLGYRGFTVARHDPTSDAIGQFRIHESIVDRGVGLPNLVDNAEAESFLLNAFRGQLPADVYEHAVASLTGTRNFRLSELAAPCPTCHAADAPAYNPSAWNIPSVQPNNNCYNYANDNATNTFAQPGRAHGKQASVLDCAHVEPAAAADGLVAAANFTANLAAGAGWYVALVIWPGTDYHWYRQDKVGCWSHKPGQTAVRDIDNAGNKIVDPKTCNRGPYTVFCDYMVTKRGLTIS